MEQVAGVTFYVFLLTQFTVQRVHHFVKVRCQISGVKVITLEFFVAAGSLFGGVKRQKSNEFMFFFNFLRQNSFSEE